MPYRVYVFKEFFVRRFINAAEDLTPGERKALEKLGGRLEALKDGSLRPQTDDDKHFLLVLKGAVSPSKIHERAWMKYQTLLASEAELEKSRREAFRQSPEYEEHLRSRPAATMRRDAESAMSQDAANDNQLKKCSACGGTVYDCWKCNGRGWVE